MANEILPVNGVNFKWVHEIPGYEDVAPAYCVGSDGFVWSLFYVGCHGIIGDTWNLLTVKVRGHLKQCRNVSVMRGEQPWELAIGRLVLSAFVGSCPDGLECCHNDGNPDNNNVANLRWDTHDSNMKDKIRHGTSNAGVRHPLSKLTDEEVIQIREAYKTGFESHRTLGYRYNVRSETIGKVVRGERWKHLL